MHFFSLKNGWICLFDFSRSFYVVFLILKATILPMLGINYSSSFYESFMKISKNLCRVKYISSLDFFWYLSSCKIFLSSVSVLIGFLFVVLMFFLKEFAFLLFIAKDYLLVTTFFSFSIILRKNTPKIFQH